MYLIMHGMVFVPAVVFCTVAGICWMFCAALDRFDRRPAWPAAVVANAARPARRGFRPILIEGGLIEGGLIEGGVTEGGVIKGGAISSLRVRQTPLGSAGARTKIGAARSYGG